MITREAQLKGSKAGGQAVKKKAKESYYADPTFCLECGCMIKLNGKIPSVVKKQKFCSRSCAATHNNRQTPKRSVEGRCKSCGCSITTRRKFCDPCLLDSQRTRLGTNIESLTKAELRRLLKDSNEFKVFVTKHARKMYVQSSKPKICKVCGYDKHYEVSHIKQVRDFPESETIRVINDLNNLVALCRNHHWEFDHGLLTLDAV